MLSVAVGLQHGVSVVLLMKVPVCRCHGNHGHNAGARLTGTTAATLTPGCLSTLWLRHDRSCCYFWFLWAISVCFSVLVHFVLALFTPCLFTEVTESSKGSLGPRKARRRGLGWGLLSFPPGAKVAEGSCCGSCRPDLLLLLGTETGAGVPSGSFWPKQQQRPRGRKEGTALHWIFWSL